MLGRKKKKLRSERRKKRNDVERKSVCRKLRKPRRVQKKDPT